MANSSSCTTSSKDLPVAARTMRYACVSTVPAGLPASGCADFGEQAARGRQIRSGQKRIVLGLFVDDDFGTDLDVAAQFIDLLIGQRDAALGPVDVLVDGQLVGRDLADAVDADRAAERRVLRRQVAGPGRLDDGVEIRARQQAIFEPPIGVLDIGVIEQHEPVKAIAVPDLDDAIDADGRLVIANLPLVALAAVAEGGVESLLHPVAAHQVKQALGLDDDDFIIGGGGRKRQQQRGDDSREPPELFPCPMGKCHDRTGNYGWWKFMVGNTLANILKVINGCVMLAPSKRSTPPPPP